MDETAAYDALRPRLQGLGLDPQRVENVLNKGTPDVWYTHGALEMKYRAVWPALAATPVGIDYRPGQVPWLYRRWLAGGLSWTMVRVDRQYLLFSGFDAPDMGVAGLTKEELLRYAVWKTTETGLGDWRDMGLWLTGKWEGLPIYKQAHWMRLRCCTSIETLAAKSGLDAERIIAAETGDHAAALELIDYWQA